MATKKTPKIHFNRETIEQVKESVSIVDLAENLGLEPEQRGINIVCYCPNPDHDDSHKTNCFLYEEDNHGYCFGCGFSFDTIGLLKAQKYSFPEAISYLAGMTNMKVEGSSYAKPNPLFLTPKEKELIGLSKKNSTILPQKIVPKKEKDTIMDCEGNYIKGERVNDLWNTMLDDKARQYIIINKCKETILALNRLMQTWMLRKVEAEANHNDFDTKCYELLYKKAKEEYDAVLKIGNRAANAVV